MEQISSAFLGKAQHPAFPPISQQADAEETEDHHGPSGGLRDGGNGPSQCDPLITFGVLRKKSRIIHGKLECPSRKSKKVSHWIIESDCQRVGICGEVHVKVSRKRVAGRGSS